mgnify:FL=1
MTTATVAPSFGIEAERLRRLGQRDRAIALCREGLAVYPDHISARVTLGYALMEHGERPDEWEAHRELKAVLERAPDNLAAIRGLAALHSRGIEEHLEAHDVPLADVVMPAPELARTTPVADDLLLAMPVSELTPASLAPAPVIEESLPMLDWSGWSTTASVVDAAEPPASEPLRNASPDVAWASDTEPAGAVAFEAAGAAAFEPAGAAAFEPAGAAAFEIEDVIDAAELPHVAAEAEAFADEGSQGLDVVGDLSDVTGRFTMDDLDPVLPPARPDPVPVPELSAGPVAVLDEWLTRIRARRMELLSQYAAS